MHGCSGAQPCPPLAFPQTPPPPAARFDRPGALYCCCAQFPPPHPLIYGFSTYYQDQPGSADAGGKPGKKGEGQAYSLVDKVRVPEQKGAYILSFRWDCEQTAQIWNACADIEVV